MRRSAEELNISEYLTSYLKYFKASFNVQMTLIESLASGQELATWDQALAKAKDSVKGLAEQVPIFDWIDLKVNSKTLERLCMRINEFMEYRLNKLKNVVDKKLTDEIMSMCLAMHKVFTQVSQNKKQDDSNSCTDLFAKMSEVENKYILKIARCILDLSKTTKTSQHFGEILNLMSGMRVHAPKNFEDSNSNINDSALTSKRVSLMVKTKFTDFHYGSKLRARKPNFERILSSFLLPGDQINTMCDPETKNHGFHSASSNPTLKNSQVNMNSEVKSASINESRTYGQNFVSCVMSKLKDVFETNLDSKLQFKEDDLLRQLMINNRNNEQIIYRFRKKLMKHRRKKEKKESVETSNTEEKLEPITHKHMPEIETYTSKRKVQKQQRILELPLLRKRNSTKI